VIKELFGSDIQNTFTCRCGEKMVREMTASVFDLNYPDIKGRAKGDFFYRLNKNTNRI